MCYVNLLVKTKGITLLPFLVNNSLLLIKIIPPLNMNVLPWFSMLKNSALFVVEYNSFFSWSHGPEVFGEHA